MTAKLRNVRYATEQDCIDDIQRLRRGCRAGGQWTLEQTCWHLNQPLQTLPAGATTAEPTPEQAKRQEFLDRVIADGWPSSGGNSPPEMVPPPAADSDAIDALVASLEGLAKQSERRVDAFLFGPVSLSKLRKFLLIHAAHHLNHFEPTT